MAKDIEYLEVKCPECNGSGVVGPLSTCPNCGGDVNDPDTNIGSGRLQLSVADFLLFFEEAKRIGLLDAKRIRRILE